MDKYTVVAAVAITFLLASSGLVYLHLSQCKQDANLTVTLLKSGRVQMYKPRLSTPMYQRHVIMANVSNHEPAIISIMRDTDKLTVFLMRLSIEQKDNVPYISILLR